MYSGDESAANIDKGLDDLFDPPQADKIAAKLKGQVLLPMFCALNLLMHTMGDDKAVVLAVEVGHRKDVYK